MIRKIGHRLIEVVCLLVVIILFSFLAIVQSLIILKELFIKSNNTIDIKHSISQNEEKHILQKTEYT